MPETTGHWLMMLLTTAWLLPLAGFVVEIYWLRWSHRLSKRSAFCAVGCIGTGFICSLTALILWMGATGFSLFEPATSRTRLAHHDADRTITQVTAMTRRILTRTTTMRISRHTRVQRGMACMSPHSAPLVKRPLPGRTMNLARFGGCACRWIGTLTA